MVIAGKIFCFFVFLQLMTGISCRTPKADTLFSRLDHAVTGITFRNTLFDNNNFNVLNYVYFYNGGGVAVGDINNDGLSDILFTGNMVKNRLYLNKGNFNFDDITDKSGIAEKQGWCSGATMTDINGDGLVDIYICRSADALSSRRKNLLFINNGDLTFSEQAEAYGLADPGYSTQASFFDYDKDGDLDMFLINHSVQEYATGAVDNAEWRKKRQPAYDCKLFRNNKTPGMHHPVFEDVSAPAGITSNVLTFGLGLTVSDMNNDGWPDVYVSNDFNEPDYFFVNNGDGTFSEKLDAYMDQASLYSMGADAADYNNDGWIDLVTLDMLPEGNEAQKMHMGAENFDKFQRLFQQGFYYQYSRNMLHTNNGDGSFSEIGQLAGISNTDWSWAALLSDFDNDGYKDMLASTGYVKDYTNMDFIQYSVDLSVKQRNGEKVDAVTEYINKMPDNKLTASMFRNDGNNGFVRMDHAWGFTHQTVATGAVYVDLDNDGNLDIVMNNTNDYAGIYRNNGTKNNFLKVKLAGDSANPTGIGAKVQLFAGRLQLHQEQVPVRGYQSSVDPILNFGVGTTETIDSALVIWPDDRFELVKNIKVNQQLSFDKKNSNGTWKYNAPSPSTYFEKTNIVDVTHKENDFNDFGIQSLLPHYFSRQGPCMAKADVNGDGREDIFIGGAKGQQGRLLLQNNAGRFIISKQDVITADSLSEDVAAVFFDANGDGHPDLYVGSGGYEFAEDDPLLQDRLYFNDGNGNFHKKTGTLPRLFNSTGCVKVADIDNDGDMDIFVGGRVVPGRYPETPESALLLNDGTGRFTNATDKAAPAIRETGMVTGAALADINKDGWVDLILAGEWMPVKIFENKNGILQDASEKYIPHTTNGWWNTITADDFDNDGDIDFVLGNQGLNNQFKASEKEPLSIYYSDFDANGTPDLVFCYFVDGVSFPAASRDDLFGQLPSLHNKFKDYASYAKATIKDLFTPEQLREAKMLHAGMLSTTYLQNNGTEGFSVRELPQQAQYAPVHTILSCDINNDGKKDIILAGNNAWTRIKFGRYRANHGIVLLGDGKGGFTYLSQHGSGLNIRADIRSMEMLHVNNKQVLFLGVNDGPLINYTLQ